MIPTITPRMKGRTMDPEIPRYFIDIRSDILAVRDRQNTHPDYDYLVLDSETMGVVWYEYGRIVPDNTGGHWEFRVGAIERAYAKCDRLNNEAAIK